MRPYPNGSNDTKAGATRSRHLPPLALAVALSVAVAACGGGSASPPPNPLFVSTATGSDGNRGTADSPLRSIGRATQIAGDDYTIVVAPGTYAEAVTTDRTGFATAQRLAFLADTNGLVFQSFGGARGQPGDVTIESPGVGIKLNSSSGTLIDGFTISGATDGGIVINKSNDVRVENCVVSGAMGKNGDGIRVQTSASVIVFNNLVFDNDQYGIALVAGSSAGSIINNTVVGNAVRGINIGNSDQGSPGAFVHNNIIQDNGSGGVGDNIKVFTSTAPSQDSLAGFDGDYNLVFPPGTYDPPSSLPGTHDVNLDALFVAGTPNAFFLQCDNPPTCSLGSPALDAGGPLPSALQALQSCISEWTTTGQTQDHAGLDLGYHLPDTHPLCAAPAPTPTS